MSRGSTKVKLIVPGDEDSVIVSEPALLLSVYYQAKPSLAGQVQLKDGSGSGDIQFDIGTVEGNGTQVMTGAGIPFPNGIYAEVLTNIDSITVFWERL